MLTPSNGMRNIARTKLSVQIYKKLFDYKGRKCISQTNIICKNKTFLLAFLETFDDLNMKQL